MKKDDVLSKKLHEVEGKKKHYLAKQVESSDRERGAEQAARMSILSRPWLRLYAA